LVRDVGVGEDVAGCAEAQCFEKARAFAAAGKRADYAVAAVVQVRSVCRTVGSSRVISVQNDTVGERTSRVVVRVRKRD
jgi:hypothetical protein